MAKKDVVYWLGQNTEDMSKPALIEALRELSELYRQLEKSHEQAMRTAKAFGVRG